MVDEFKILDNLLLFFLIKQGLIINNLPDVIINI